MADSVEALSTRTWFSIEQAAEYTTFAVVTLRKLVYKGAIPFYKKGRRVVFKRQEIDSWMEHDRVEPLNPDEIGRSVDRLINRERKPGRPKLIPNARRSENVEAV